MAIAIGHPVIFRLRLSVGIFVVISIGTAARFGWEYLLDAGVIEGAIARYTNVLCPPCQAAASTAENSVWSLLSQLLAQLR